jgi:hypothetical protein
MENNPAPRKMKLRLNLFDIIFIACALAVAALILLYSSRSDGGTSIIMSGSSETVVYTIEFQGMFPGTAELIAPGDALVDRVERRAVGTVVSVELMPSTTSQKSFITGNRYIVDVPGMTDAILVVSANAHVTEALINVNGFAVRVGTRVSINGPLYSGIGFIIGIERGDAA